MHINGNRHCAYNDRDHEGYQQIGTPPVLGLAMVGTLKHDIEAILSDHEMNEGTGERFDGVGIFAVEEIKIKSRQSEQCYRRTAEHGDLHNPLSELQLRKCSMQPC
jgi:hypothetical protein